LYVGLLFFIRSRPNFPSHPRASSFRLLLTLGIVQYAVLWAVATRKLSSGPGSATHRARGFFVFRAVSAEVVALYGVVVGVMGQRILECLAFFGLALAGFALSFPTREAWAEAVRIAEDPGP